MAEMLVASAVFNGLLPAKDGKEYAYPASMEKRIDFSAGDRQEFDFQKETEGAIIQFLQSVFIDNNDNSKSVILTIAGSNHRIVAKPYTQGWYACLVPNPPHFTISSVGSDAVVPLIFMNVPMAAAVW